MASSRRVLLRLQGDSSDSRRAISEVRADLRRMSREEARVRLDIQTARVERSIENVKRRLADLDQQKPSPSVDLKTAKANEQLALLQLKLDRLSLKKVNIDVDVRRGGVERTAATLGSVERGVGSVVTGIGDALRAIPIFGQVFATALNGAISLASTLGQALGGLVTTGIESLGNTFKSLTGLGALAGPIGAITASFVGLVAQAALLAAIGGGVVIALNAVLGAVVALGGALVALVASLAAAVAGLGALAVAFGGVLIPVVAVAIGLFTRFAAILKARQAREQELAQSVQAQKTAEQQRKTALDQVRSAHQRLADAVVEGRKAMANAAREEQNAELALQNSQLGLKSARIGVLEAKRDLRNLLQQAGITGRGLDKLVHQFSDVHVDPTKLQGLLGAVQGAGQKKQLDPVALQRAILNVQLAQQGVKNAVQDTANAENRLGEATKKRADFAKRGLDAYKPYRTALEAVRRAETRLVRAQDQSTAAQRKYERALKGLSASEQGALSRLDQFINGFKRLAKAFTDPIFRAANDVFDSLKGRASFLQTALTGVGQAMGDALRQFGAFLREPRTATIFQTMAKGAAELVRVGTSGFLNLLRILGEIAVTALPAVTKAARDVRDWLARIAGQPGAIHTAIHAVVIQFQAWARLAGSVFGLVKDIFGIAAPQGKSLADSMRRVVDHWREWVRDEANREKVKEFFRNAVIRARQIFSGIRSIVKWLKNDLPKAAKTAKSAFSAIYSVIKKIIDAADKIKQIARDAADILGVGQSPSDAISQAQNDFAIVKRDQAKLKEHLTPQQRSFFRADLIAALKDLLSLPKQSTLITSQGEAQLRKLLNELVKKQAQPIRQRPQDHRSPDAKASVVNHHYHITAPAGHQPDPRATVAHIRNLITLGG